jgi:hypothetical protein
LTYAKSIAAKTPLPQYPESSFVVSDLDYGLIIIIFYVKTRNKVSVTLIEKKEENAVITALRFFFLLLLSLCLQAGCASAPPEPPEPEPLTEVLARMKTSYFSCTNFFAPEDVSLALGRQPTRCRPLETTRNTIGVIVKRDQTEPVITCVLPGSPAESGRLQSGAVVWAVATEGVSTPEGALEALQRHMKEGKTLVITTDRGTVSVVPRRASVQRCFWQVPGDVSTGIVHYRSQDDDVSIASVRHSSKPGSSEIVATFLDGWLVDIGWTHRN